MKWLEKHPQDHSRWMKSPKQYFYIALDPGVSAAYVQLFRGASSSCVASTSLAFAPRVLWRVGIPQSKEPFARGALGFRTLNKNYIDGLFFGRKLQRHVVEHFFFNQGLGESRFLLGLLFVVQTVQSSYFVGRFLKWNPGGPWNPLVEGSWDAALCANQVIIPNSARRGFRPGEWPSLPPHFGSMKIIKGPQ